MFCLTTLEKNVLFNYAPNTFILRRRVYGKGPFGQRERKPAATTWAALSDSQQNIFYIHYPTDEIVHTTAFVNSLMELSPLGYLG